MRESRHVLGVVRLSCHDARHVRPMPERMVSDRVGGEIREPCAGTENDDTAFFEVTFSTARGDYRIYGERQVNELIEELRRADLVVGYNSPYKTVADLVSKAKSQPGSVSYGSAGNGGSARRRQEPRVRGWRPPTRRRARSDVSWT